MARAPPNQSLLPSHDRPLSHNQPNNYLQAEIPFQSELAPRNPKQNNGAADKAGDLNNFLKVLDLRRNYALSQISTNASINHAYKCPSRFKLKRAFWCTH